MGTVKSSECRICAIVSGQYAMGEVDRPWLENDRYMSFTSVGALVEGWSLISPRTHRLNLLAEYDDSEFVEFVRRAISVVEALYGSSVVFEHGGQVEGSATNCGTSHAHLHIVPLKFSLQAEVGDFDKELQWQKCSLTEINERVGRHDYLFVADQYNGASTEGSLCILEEGRSQFFRRVIASKLGRASESNYRTHPNLDTAELAAGALRLFSDRAIAA